jgi:hypothetical protein
MLCTGSQRLVEREARERQVAQLSQTSRCPQLGASNDMVAQANWPPKKSGISDNTVKHAVAALKRP